MSTFKKKAKVVMLSTNEPSKIGNNPKDNTITIKKVKDSYSRAEVIGFGNKVKEYCKDGWKSDSLHRVFFEWDKWIEENL